MGGVAKWHRALARLRQACAWGSINLKWRIRWTQLGKCSKLSERAIRKHFPGKIKSVFNIIERVDEIK
ncbi:hypothetical protein COT52_03100 [candidate division WWE3 bacterium CG08_land_8_20_14_0_20_43_13]|uniref:Uncharacterized protein n=2 Tax=Bacteria candidate phyla TaxID=1783234 RepID=A0A2H0X8X9_UNCKA|nr:MAG: hypothetical protein COT52_03100 [candidate division WWE3 bacterium CG08_land_8_20_14_0_20_43_13]PJE73203.1 MAG: hypothetical protein COV00_01135 [Candidatus Tagabacteria bacterium CG10_big_fil_rev_8_21_14_0_10_40_13]